MLPKKRILFYSENFCDAGAKGGTEVATFRIAKALKETGNYDVYNAFCGHGNGKEKSIFADVVRLPKGSRSFKNSLSRFIRDNEIDYVVNMTRFFRHKSISSASEKSGRDTKVIFMQHFAPGSEFKKATYKSGLHLLKLNPLNPLYWLRASIYPLLKLRRNRILPQIYRHTYENSHKVILLSEGYIEDYCRIAGIEGEGEEGKERRKKFAIIPNIFEVSRARDQKDKERSVSSKKKRVLILSRMDEIQKRLSLALLIWQKIEKDADLSDWWLDIVGTGHNLDIVKKLIKKLKLDNVVVHGWQPRENFLRDSAILMMTSEYEGLPLSILEAKAYGCVPIAFDSFASLRDVVTEFHDGVIVDEFGDTDAYARKLSELMYDKDYRDELARNAVDSADNFSAEKIAREWSRILT